MLRSTSLFIGTSFTVAVFTIFATSNVDWIVGIPHKIYSMQSILIHIYKKPISLLNVPICTQGMQRTWWPEAGTIIVTGPYSMVIHLSHLSEGSRNMMGFMSKPPATCCLSPSGRHMWGCEHDNSLSLGWIVLEFDACIAIGSALSWLLFQGYGSMALYLLRTWLRPAEFVNTIIHSSIHIYL